MKNKDVQRRSLPFVLDSPFTEEAYVILVRFKLTRVKLQGTDSFSIFLLKMKNSKVGFVCFVVVTTT